MERVAHLLLRLINGFTPPDPRFDSSSAELC